MPDSQLFGLIPNLKLGSEKIMQVVQVNSRFILIDQKQSLNYFPLTGKYCRNCLGGKRLITNLSTLQNIYEWFRFKLVRYYLKNFSTFLYYSSFLFLVFLCIFCCCCFFPGVKMVDHKVSFNICLINNILKDFLKQKKLNNTTSTDITALSHHFVLFPEFEPPSGHNYFIFMGIL